MTIVFDLQMYKNTPHWGRFVLRPGIYRAVYRAVYSAKVHPDETLTSCKSHSA